MERGQRATILDVAARAGVHAATVSRTINVPEKVAPDTRLRVEAAIRDLGFVPNRAARGLITGRTGNVAVIVPDITNPHFASLVRSVERSARQSDLQVLLVDTGEHPDEEVRAAESLSREVDGFIVVSPRRLHRSLGALGSIPAVFVNRPVPEHASILLRTAPAVTDALVHLSDLGHTRLAYLGGPAGSWAAGERRNAVRHSGRTSGFDVLELDVGEPTFDATAVAVPDIVASGVSAVLAFNDQMALGVDCRAAHARPVRARGHQRRGIRRRPHGRHGGAAAHDDQLADAQRSVRSPLPMLGEGPASRELFGELVVRHSTARVR